MAPASAARVPWAAKGLLWQPLRRPGTQKSSSRAHSAAWCGQGPPRVFEGLQQRPASAQLKEDRCASSSPRSMRGRRRRGRSDQSLSLAGSIGPLGNSCHAGVSGTGYAQPRSRLTASGLLGPCPAGRSCRPQLGERCLAPQNVPNDDPGVDGRGLWTRTVGSAALLSFLAIP